MTNKDFYEMVNESFNSRLEIMKAKGKEYTIGSDDKLQNFKDVARQLGLRPMQVWDVYFSKHIASIHNYVKDGIEASNESIEGRIMDAQNYLDLFQALVIEERLAKANG